MWLYTVAVIVILTTAVIASSPKNVLMIVADDMRPEIGAWNGVNPAFYGNIHTPNLDALASRSLVLHQAFAQQARCNPSRTSVLTGRRPESTHIYDLKSYFRNMAGNFTTLPQYFKNHGYQSIGIGKVFHWGKGSNWGDAPSWSLPYFHADRSHWKGKSKCLYEVPSQERQRHPLQDDLVRDRALETIKDLSRDAVDGNFKPFFLAVGFHKPHFPFIVPKDFFDLYPTSTISMPDDAHVPSDFPPIAWSSNSELRGYRDLKHLHLTGAFNSTVPQQTALALRRAYYASVSYIDSLIGQILDELKTQGLHNDTIIAFWGDHGFLLGEHGMWGKNSTFELATLSPLMVSVPGKTDTGLISAGLTELVDLYPTLVELAGLPQLPLCPAKNPNNVIQCTEGRSFGPLIHGPENPWKSHVFSLFPRKKKMMGYSIRSADGYRYTKWVGYDHKTQTPLWDHVIGEELYNHTQDAGEDINQAYFRDKNIRRKKRQLHRLLRLGWRGATPGGIMFNSMSHV